MEVTPTLSPTSPPTPRPDAGPFFAEAPDRDLYELARSLVLKTSDPIPEVVNPDPVSYSVGRRDTFWIVDTTRVRTFTTEATLRLVSPHAYWYVEDGNSVSDRNIVNAARAFEEEIYPKVKETFGTEWTPGVDNDEHMTILHARLEGVLGYFSAVDEYPSTVHPNSNQREMIYLNVGSMGIGSSEYLAVLAHELQHAVHWRGDPTEETWVSEGLSELATKVSDQRPDSYVGNFQQDTFLRFPSISLVNWPLHASANYGAAFLFFEYLSSHYGSPSDLLDLVQEPKDGIEGIDSYLAHLGYEESFNDVFKDWVVANYLDESVGPYSYPNVNVGILPARRLGEVGDTVASLIPQYSAEYTAIDIFDGDVVVRFQGQKETPILPQTPDTDRCWWSNRGDSISSTLTRPIDLSGVDRATLQFRIWFEVEDQWDYGYIQVSTDDGSTWDILRAPATTPRNPVGNSFGPGYTGNSDGWLQQRVDLDSYVGREVLLRFHYVTDLAVNTTGICLDDISVPEISFSDDDSADDGWQAEGFISMDNKAPQHYAVRVVEVGANTSVRDMELDENNSGEMLITGLETFDDVVVVVAAMAPKSSQEAPYTLKVESAP